MWIMISLAGKGRLLDGFLHGVVHNRQHLRPRDRLIVASGPAMINRRSEVRSYLLELWTFSVSGFIPFGAEFGCVSEDLIHVGDYAGFFVFAEVDGFHSIADSLFFVVVGVVASYYQCHDGAPFSRQGGRVCGAANSVSWSNASVFFMFA
jgi:hypothetical protein